MAGQKVYGHLAVTKNLDHVKFILPTADVRPVTMNNNFPCPAWFDITGLESRANETCSGLDESCDRIIAICQDEIGNHRIPPTNRIVIGGFSQGGALSLFTSLSRAFQPAGVVCMSGYLPRQKPFRIGKIGTPITTCQYACFMASKTRLSKLNGLEKVVN